MDRRFEQPRGDLQQAKLLQGALVLIAMAAAVSGLILFLSVDLSESLPYFFLLPWIFGLALVISFPSLVLYRQGEFTLANPIVFATWSYFFPAFVVGGIMLSVGFSQPYFLDHLQDPEYNLPYSVVLIAIGFSGLAAGYFLPLGKKIGRSIDKYLPTANYPPETYAIPGLCLLGLGMASLITAFVLGIAGYQVSEQMNSYDGLLVATTQFWVEAAFLLWFIIFRKGRWDTQSYIVAAIVLSTFLIRALYAGNRSSFVHLFIIILLAYILARREFGIRLAIKAGGVLVVCLIVGMIYGTTFRAVKGYEVAVGVGQYTRSIFDTLDKVGREDSLHLLQFASVTLAERMDTLSSVAVVVSKYEQLQPYEEQYGLKDNILNDLTTFFIPRIMWSDKPVSSDARRYGDLYFDYGENSFAMTPMGDLLRNFGPLGVPIGMCLLGVILRIIFSSLVDEQPPSAWRCALYFILLTTVSYESFYGLIIPNLAKYGFIAVVGVLIVSVLAYSLKRRGGTTPQLAVARNMRTLSPVNDAR